MITLKLSKTIIKILIKSIWLNNKKINKFRNKKEISFDNIFKLVSYNILL